MTGTGDNAADAAVFNENDASIMLIVLSGREAPCGLNAEMLNVRKRVIAAEKQLEWAKTRLRLNIFHRSPRISRNKITFMLQQDALRAEVTSLEALLVNLEAESRFIAANPNAFSQVVHKEDKEQDDDLEEQDNDVEEQDDDIIDDSANADADRVVETGKEADDAEDKEQDDWKEANRKDKQFAPFAYAFETSLENEESSHTGRPEEQESLKRKRNESAGLKPPPGSFHSIRPSRKTAQSEILNAQDKETALKKAPSTRSK
jgi:hypothetical protein